MQTYAKHMHIRMNSFVNEEGAYAITHLFCNPSTFTLDEVQPISERKTFSVTGIRTRGGSDESCPWSRALDPPANQPHIWKCFWTKWNWKFFEALQLTSTVSIRAKSVVHFSTFPRNNPETSEWKGRVRFSSALSAQNERKLSIFTAPKKSL